MFSVILLYPTNWTKSKWLFLQQNQSLCCNISTDSRFVSNVELQKKMSVRSLILCHIDSSTNCREAYRIVLIRIWFELQDAAVASATGGVTQNLHNLENREEVKQIIIGCFAFLKIYCEPFKRYRHLKFYAFKFYHI